MKKLFIFLITTFLLFLAPSSILAFVAQSHVSLVFPVRELSIDPERTYSTLDIPRLIYREASPSGHPITWLLDPDTLDSIPTTSFFQDISQDPTQEIGLILEITPQLLEKFSLESSNHSGVRQFTNSYTTQDRVRVVDYLMQQFFDKFGTYPLVVGAEYLDSFTLEYLRNHYSVLSAIFNIPTTNQPSPTINGFSPLFPYFPSNQNALVPAQNREDKIAISISYWNPPTVDGRSIPFSSESAFTKALSEYSLKDLNEFTYLAIGTVNDTDPDDYLPIFKNILKSLVANQNKFSIKFTKAGEFGRWINQYYPFTNGAYHLRDISSSGGTIHYANPFYQITIIQKDGQTSITNLSIFNASSTESFRLVANTNDNLTLSTFSVISPSNPVNLDLDLTQTTFASEYWDLIATQSGKILRLEPNKIVTNLELDLPDHPSIKKTRANGLTVYNLDSKYTPFVASTKTHLVNTLKLIVLVLVILALFRLPPPKLLNLLKKHIFLAITILILSGIWLVTTYKSGSPTLWGLSFWGAHEHDAIFHLALIESFKESLWPLNNPLLAGTLIKNYHLFYDYLLALLSRILNIPAIDLYFRLIPVLISLSIGILGASLMKKWKFSNASIIISLISVYLAGSLGFIPHFISSGSLWGGESAFWVQQSITTLTNPPFALSLVLLLLVLNLLESWKNNLTAVRLVTLSLLAALLIQTKAYGALLLLSALFIHIIFSLFSNKSKPSRPKLTIFLALTLVFSAIIFLPTYAPAQSTFIFRPLWFVESMFASTDRLNWNRIATAWQNYQLQGNYPKLIALHLVGLIIFIAGNLGIRLLAIPTWLSSFHNRYLSQRLVAIIILIGLSFPLIFIQSGNSWNSIQFTYYSLFFLSLLTGPVIVSILDRSHILPKFLFLLFVFSLLTFPTTIGTLKNYLSVRPSSAISYEELSILGVLARQPNGIVLSPVHNTGITRVYRDPRPLFAANSNAYISALTSKPSYLADEINLTITDYDFQEQKKLSQRFFNTTDLSFVQSFLKQNNISYIYLPPSHRLNFSTKKANLELIFSSGNFNLYKVR